MDNNKNEIKMNNKMIKQKQGATILHESTIIKYKKSNQIVKILAIMMILIIALTGCGTIDDTTRNKDGNEATSSDNGTNQDTNDNDDSNSDTDEDLGGVEFKAEVIESGDSLLITPDKESGEAKSSDRIVVATNNVKMINQDGDEITLKDLKPGDILKITYNGVILESYPAQITASKIEVIGKNLIIDGYLAIIDDIYQEDAGLNSEIEMITFDTTGWVELSVIEKEIVLAQLKETYGLEIKEGTFDELTEQGIIDKDNLYFENGVHIKISNIKYNEKEKEFTYSIEKWRSGLGAIGADDVSAKYKDGNWNIKKENMWVS